MFKIPVIEGVSAVGSCDAGDQSQINAFSEAPELGARFDATVDQVHVGGIMNGGKKKKKRSTRGKKKGHSKRGNGKKSRGKGVRGKQSKGKKTRGKKRQHRKKGYKMTLRR